MKTRSHKKSHQISSIRDVRRTEKLSQSQQEEPTRIFDYDIDLVTISDPFTDNSKEKDYNPRIKSKQFKRPYFSPYLDSYDGDLMFMSYDSKYNLQPYLVLVNINTRYAYIYLLLDKSNDSLIRAFDDLLRNGVKINNLRFDGESGIDNKHMRNYFFQRGINFFSSTSPYTNKSRIVDRFIRILKDAYARVEKEYSKKYKLKNIDYDLQHDLLQQIVAIYNNKYHRSIGMAPIEMNNEEEKAYIKVKQLQLKAIKQKQKESNYFNLEEGQPIKIYLDTSKTKEGFQKKRGNYIRDATFLYYNHGNAVVKITNKIGRRTSNEIIEIPIYWVKV